MSHVTGLIVIDAPASALNNAGRDEEARTENAVAVKFIRAPEGRYPYVSAQAIRYWLRTQLAKQDPSFASPVHREEKVAYTDANPAKYADDDLFGYMRAPGSLEAEKGARAKGLTPLDEEKRNGRLQPVSITRVSPLRLGTLVAISAVRITRDWGVMARLEGDPVIHEHQFYRAHLTAPIATDLTCAGTFFDSARVGFRNLSAAGREAAVQSGATEIHVHGLRAFRLPINERRRRVAVVIRGIGALDGGAKQTLHLTDTAPAVLVLAVCRHGNQPFQRLFGPGNPTAFREDVLAEALRVFGSDIQSDVYIGWATGFLDVERRRLLDFVEQRGGQAPRVRVGHPHEMAEEFARAIEDPERQSWFE